MADSTKHIAGLDFDIEKANKQLEELSKKINSFSGDTEKTFKKVGEAIESGLKDVNISAVMKRFSDSTKNIKQI